MSTANAHAANVGRHGEPIDRRILEEAANWLMRLHAGAVTDADRAACALWRQQSPAHAQAWARAERLMATLGGLPPALALRALDRPASPARRAAVARLAGLLVAVPALWAISRATPWDRWLASEHTETGGQRQIRLADGTHVTLGAASAIDVRFDAGQRLVTLRAGEILIETAPDPAPVHRPFLVEVAQGRLEALGTRFDVRLQRDTARVAVLEGAVRVQPRAAPPSASRILHAGDQADLTERAVGAIDTADDTVTAWTRGMLVADRMRLDDLAAELARYRSGVVRCDPVIAALPISGAFPIADTERTLAMLAATYPVDAVMRTGLWVTLVARRQQAATK